MGRRESPLPRGASGSRTRRGEAAGRRVSVEPELGGSNGDGAARVSRGGGGTDSRGFGEGVRCLYRGADRALACGPRRKERRGAHGDRTLRESTRRGEEDGPDGRDPPVGDTGGEGADGPARARDWAGGGRLGRGKEKGKGKGLGRLRRFGPKEAFFSFFLSFARDSNKFNLNSNLKNSNSN